MNSNEAPSGIVTSQESKQENSGNEEDTYSFRQSVEDFLQISKACNNSSTEDDFIEVKVLRGKELMQPLFEAASASKAHILGGAVRWMCSPLSEPVPSQDVDIFPSDMSSLAKLQEKLIGIGYVVARTTSMTIDMELRGAKRTSTLVDKVQLVMPRTHKNMIIGTEYITEQMKTLDFTVSRIGLRNLNSGIADTAFLQDEQKKRLVIRHIVCPVAAIKRLMKYAHKGYSCPTTEIIKVFAEWSKRSFEPYSQPLSSPSDVEAVTHVHPGDIMLGFTVLESKRLGGVTDEAIIAMEKTLLQRALRALYVD